MDNAVTTVDSHGNVRCAECKRFVKGEEAARGVQIRHASYCDSKAQPVVGSAPVVSEALREKVSRGRAAIRNGAISAVLTDDEIVDARRQGLISNDDAMNRDF